MTATASGSDIPIDNRINERFRHAKIEAFWPAKNFALMLISAIIINTDPDGLEIQ